MKTAPPAHLANVVNASVTMFFHSLQRIIGRARPALRRFRRVVNQRGRHAWEFGSLEAGGDRFESGRIDSWWFRSAARSCPSGETVPRRSRARSRIAGAVPAAGAGVDRPTRRPIAFVIGIKG